MKPSEECKLMGLMGLRELSKLSGKSAQTLINWHAKSKFLFDSELKKAVTKKHDMDFIKQVED